MVEKWLYSFPSGGSFILYTELHIQPKSQAWTRSFGKLSHAGIYLTNA